nr:hypothetical protein [Tanacetum cinerariifolium]GFA26934.1 hypothetical protein [Tanacetum cinerariifolium]
LDEFHSSYFIPSEYRVILPTPTQTILDAPHGYIGLYTHCFCLANLRLPLNDFFCELLLKENMLDVKSFKDKLLSEPLRTNEEPAVEPMSEPATEPVNERVGTTVDLGGVPKEILLLFTLGVLFFEASCKKETGFWFVNLAHCRAKASAIKDDTPVLSIFDNDEGLEDCLELKDATACHLKISAITPPAWKDFLDNHLDVDLLDLHDRCYPRQAIMDNAVNR